MKRTPRQKVAILNPCISLDQAEHPRFHQCNGRWQSVLTFDRKRGRWHAVVGTWPVAECWTWNAKQKKQVKVGAMRLLARVGQGDVDIQPNARPATEIHFYRTATAAEIVEAESNYRDRRRS